MSYKIFLVLVIVLTISNIGSALKCNVCAYWTTQPKAQQKCPGVTAYCPSGYSNCFTSSSTYQNGTEVVERGCGDTRLCPDAKKACNLATKRLDLKSCAAACCNTDNCNDYTLSSATGVMVTKFTLSLMVVVGFIFA